MIISLRLLLAFGTIGNVVAVKQDANGGSVSPQLKLINDKKFVEYIGHLTEYVRNICGETVDFKFIPKKLETYY